MTKLARLSKPVAYDRMLDPKQRQIVAFVIEGLKDREIASKMSMTPQQVKKHLSGAFIKLGVGDRLELVFRLASSVVALPPRSDNAASVPLLRRQAASSGRC